MKMLIVFEPELEHHREYASLSRDGEGTHDQQVQSIFIFREDTFIEGFFVR